MRGDNQLPGVQHSMELDFAYISGNTEIVELNGSYRADYVSSSNWYGFLIWKYDRAFEKLKEDFTYKGFGHLRIAKPFMIHTDIEGFSQKEFNHFIDLENRELVGFGFRVNHFDDLSWGLGIMGETEKYQNLPQEQNFTKSTNYLNYTIKFLEIIEIQNILYYQFKLEKLEDYRILWDGKLSFQGSDWFSFYISYNYRYDISEINKDGSSYFEVNNGLGFRF